MSSEVEFDHELFERTGLLRFKDQTCPITMPCNTQMRRQKVFAINYHRARVLLGLRKTTFYSLVNACDNACENSRDKKKREDLLRILGVAEVPAHPMSFGEFLERLSDPEVKKRNLGIDQKALKRGELKFVNGTDPIGAVCFIMTGDYHSYWEIPAEKICLPRRLASSIISGALGHQPTNQGIREALGLS